MIQKLRHKKWKKIIQKSGLFDVKYYLFTYPDVREQDIGPIMHYLRFGAKEGRNPSEDFDTRFYLDTYNDVININLLVHYIQYGKLENRAKNQKEFQHNEEYHLLANSELFDKKYYFQSNPDLGESIIDPMAHYLLFGEKEGRKPNKDFDPMWYRIHYKDLSENNISSLVHYILHGKDEKRFQNKQELEANIRKQQKIELQIQKINEDKSKDQFVEYKAHKPINTKLKTIAFYLPQFHPFPENDKWWGKGFTEWTNVAKATPNFAGHYQPHLPIHNGFYDLRIPEVMIEQAKLARNYGIHGFNFYYYWFDGKILMHKPFEILLNHKEIDINFCITWANENWTRRWDGLENEVLIAQNHSEEDSIKFIHNLFKYFKDERYIRIDNKPVLIIYRSSIIPEISKMGEIWRKEAQKEGFDGLYLVCAQTTGTYNPNDIGFDATMEFPPHTTHNKIYSQELQITNPDFQGTVFDYSIAANKALEKEEPPFKLFKTSTLSWDNTARRQDNATVFHNFSIEAYKNWMKHLYQITLNNTKYSDDEKLIFVNAWNEWAEGTHLEPDRKYGYGYLQATYDALSETTNTRKIIVVSHNAYPHGAQYLALNIVMYLKNYFKYEVAIIINGEGDLTDKFQSLGNTYFIKGLDNEQKNELFKRLFERGFQKAIANTSVIGDIVEDLTLNKIEVLSLIHEMKSVIENNNLQVSIAKIKEYANKIVFPSEIVKKDFEYFEDMSHKDIYIKPQGLFRTNQYKHKKEIAREKLLEELNIDKNSKIILNIAYGDYRKGIDLFAEVGRKVVKEDQNIHFVWVGHFQVQLVNQIMESLKKENTEHNFHFVGIKEDIEHYYCGSDIFFLSSREDPFPSVVLDAMNVGLPVIAFEGAGGFTDIVSQNCGLLTDINNLNSVSETIFRLLNDEKLYNTIRINSIEKIEKDFSFTKYLFVLLEMLNEDIKKVSVIIPNYNYEKYIKFRLESILNQTYPIFEIIYLDDNSSDNSLETAQEILRNGNVPFKVIKNETNSGSVFKQWAKGIFEAQGDYIWIAESDDLCDSAFLEKVIKGFDDKEVVLSYCQSKMIDENGKVIAKNYFDYTSDISKTKWKKDYINDGVEELKTAMVVKNTIPNVSSVVFKKFDISKILDELCNFKVAGDWYFYTYLLQKGKISYCSESLNMHRRHNNSVTVSKENNEKHYNEIVDMQELIINQFGLHTQDTAKIQSLYKNKVKNILKIESEFSEKKELCILHVGMPKTGTSTLQNTFFNKVQLDDSTAYLHFPEANHSTRIIGLCRDDLLEYDSFKQMNMDIDQINKFNLTTLKILEDDLKNNNTLNRIISGEDLFHLKKNSIENLKNILKKYFKKIIVVGYVRPVKSFCESAFQQLVKNHDLGTFNFNLIYHRYKNFEYYEEVFERENVKLFAFIPENFPDGDIALDFTKKMNISPIKSKTKVVNESLSKEAISILFTYNHYKDKNSLGENRYKLNYRLIEKLKKFGTTKFKFSKLLIEEIIKRNEDDYRWIINRVAGLEEKLDLPDEESVSNENELIDYSLKFTDELSKLIKNKDINFVLDNTPLTIVKLIDLLMNEIENEI